ncbi:MAG: metallophosphoesterase [Actinomycetota bacterium]|nr:metallophosphoesterase [Actinomycetota bacterium]HZY64808.1 metallophosphoesterase [Rubrobacteraceae bacterium]
MSGRVSKKLAAATLGGALLGVGGLVWAREVETRRLEVVPVTLTLPRLASEFDGYRVVQIGDIHLDDWAKPRRLNRIVDLVNDQNPDLIAITGDCLSYSVDPGVPHRLAEALGKLKARDGVLAVTGNHDYLTDIERVRCCLRSGGVTELCNDVRTVKREGAALHFAGVDDVMEGRSRLDLVLEKVPEEGAAILLAHEPDFADVSAATGRFDLQLSGHSHGGQVRAPFWGPVFLPPFTQRYTSGLYEVGDMLQYTNRGLGFVDARLRFLCRPEITVFTLRSRGSGYAL